MTPYFTDQGIELFHGDARTLLEPGWGAGKCVILDPPWDELPLLDWAMLTMGDYESLLVFTDARRFRDPISMFGAPSWVFTWDTMNTWSMSARQPVQQTKHCLWYGARYERDAQLWGEAPPARNHPTTKQTPLAGRRLTDLWRESLRWLHHPGAGSGSAGTERFVTRQGNPAYRHAKPVGWMACLIGNTSTGPVIDPFVGSGTSIEAARDLGRPVIGIDIDEQCCAAAVQRLAQGVLDFDNQPLTGKANA